MRFSLLSLVARIDDAFLERMRDAYLIRGAQVAAAWSPIFPDVVAPDVRVVSAISDLTDEDVPGLFTGSIDEPGDLAYHFLKPDAHGVQRPYMVILADAYQPFPSVEKAGGHEMDETLVDALCARYDAAGFALEVDDPFQEDDQPVDVGRGAPVAFSPFALPAWFGVGDAAAPTNSAGLACAPHAVRPGGYAMLQNGKEITAEGYQHPPRKAAMHSRRMKRHRAMAARARAGLRIDPQAVVPVLVDPLDALRRLG